MNFKYKVYTVNKIAVLKVTMQALISVLSYRDSASFTIENGLPADSEIIDIESDLENGSFNLLIYSEEFDPVINNNLPVLSSPTVTKLDRHLIHLNDYQVANLKAAIEAAGYYTWNPLSPTHVPRNPLYALNTGDWIGELYQKLPNIPVEPNRTPQQMAEDALNFVP